MILQMENRVAIEPNTSLYSKRQEWSPARRREWAEDFRATRQDHPALSIGVQGLIQDCNKSLQVLFGFRRSDLVCQQVSKLFPQLEGIELIQAGRVNPLLNYVCRCGQLYRARTRRGDTFCSHLSIVRLEYAGRPNFRMIVRPALA
jgi:transcriptional regulator of aromatic amino acid metabolism